MFADIGAWLVQLMETVGYPGLLFATFLENIIPPIPSELIMPLAGYLASTGSMNIILVIIVGSLGSTLGTIPYFYLGKYISQTALGEWLDRWGRYIFFSRANLDALYEIFRKHDGSRVFFSRFLPGARSLISLPAGSAQMNDVKFFILTYTGTLIWTTLWTLIGYFFGAKQEWILGLLSQYEHWALGLLAVVVIGVITRIIMTTKETT